MSIDLSLLSPGTMTPQLAAPRPPGSRDRAPSRRSKVLGLTYAGHLVPPLYWWRQLPAPAFTAVHVAVIRRAITGFCLLNEPNWPSAAKGDPAAAVGVALRAIKRRRGPSKDVDLEMSALLRCAIEGSDTAALVLEYVLGRMAAKDPVCAAVAKSWRTNTVGPQAHRASKGA
jgi:hypothetical protein